MPQEGVTKTINSLEGVLIKSTRQSGNTTRIVDNVIQKLFDGMFVDIKDHHDSPTSHRDIVHRVQKRLASEFNITNNLENDHLVLSRNVDGHYGLTDAKLFTRKF